MHLPLFDWLFGSSTCRRGGGRFPTGSPGANLYRRATCDSLFIRSSPDERVKPQKQPNYGKYQDASHWSNSTKADVKSVLRLYRESNLFMMKAPAGVNTYGRGEATG